jgi:kinesin family protein C1
MSTTPKKITYGDDHDRLQARIEYLERERVDLSLQLHQRDEKERSKNIYITKLEQLRDELEESARTAKREASLLRTQKEALDIEVGQLTAQLELHKSKTAASEGLWAKLNVANREHRKAEDELQTQKSEIETLQDNNTALIKEVEKLKNQLIDACAKNAKFEQLEIEGRSFVAMLQSKCSAAEQVIGDLHTEIAELKTLNEDDRQRFESDQWSMQSEITSLTEKIEALDNQIAEAERTASNANNDLIITGNAASQISQLKEALQGSEEKRRKLHNALQELRGNIRVFVRCRPYLRGDDEEKGLTIFDASSAASAAINNGSIKFSDDGMSLSITSHNASSNRPNTASNFSFDHIFKPDVQQHEVFGEVSDYVQSALDGYRICIFSYGQTGSGKTHTMTGGRGETLRGITPRSVEQIIKQVLVMTDQGWEVSLSASMIELYNEELRDLLVAPSKDAKESKDKLKITFSQGRVVVQGLSAVEICSSDLEVGLKQINSVMDQAAKTRSTACTNMNDVSSRSHALFMLDIVCRSKDGLTTLRGGLRLCDLAGSERLDRTGTLTDATRLKETVNINKSLSCLADVFVALANKAPHIPYRNSKLTMLLQDCLSGDGKSLMIVNVSPTVASSQETICSLRFAAQVSKVELGKAQKNVYISVPAQVPGPSLAMTTAISSVPNDHNVEAESHMQIPHQSSIQAAATRAASGRNIPVGTSTPMLKPSSQSRRASLAPPNQYAFQQSLRQAQVVAPACQVPFVPANPANSSLLTKPVSCCIVTVDDMKGATNAMAEISIDKENHFRRGNENFEEQILPSCQPSVYKPTQSALARSNSVFSGNYTTAQPPTLKSVQTSHLTQPGSRRTSVAPNTATQVMRLSAAVSSSPYPNHPSQPAASQQLTTECQLQVQETSAETAQFTPQSNQDIDDPTSKVLQLSHGAGTSAAALLQQYRAKRALQQQQYCSNSTSMVSSTSPVVNLESLVMETIGADPTTANIKRIRTAPPTVPVMSAAVSAARSWR